MAENKFFDEAREQSLVKGKIVADYFWTWAKIMVNARRKHPDRRIAYVDLFAGPGRYEDGMPSTPLLVLQKAIKDKDIAETLVTLFNDKNPGYVQSLQSEISKIPNLDKLKYKPKVLCDEVGIDILPHLQKIGDVPTLSFLDPWGYKGLSLQLVSFLIEGWGCDCIFFFNYNRINIDLANPLVVQHMDALFGQERAKDLREHLVDSTPLDRELTVVNELAQALKDHRGEFVLPFRFKSESAERTSHQLVFVSKHFRGYALMKEVMARHSTKAPQGVPSLEYNPADKRYPLLFELTQPLDDLPGMLLKEFSGRVLTREEVYEQHNVGKPYIKGNYKDALMKLEAEGRIEVDPPAERRKTGTFGDNVRVTFP